MTTPRAPLPPAATPLSAEERHQRITEGARHARYWEYRYEATVRQVEQERDDYREGRKSPLCEACGQELAKTNAALAAAAEPPSATRGERR